MLKGSLQLRQGMSLKMTPQLQQTIKLLQYSSLELQNQIQNMLLENPMLEHEENFEYSEDIVESDGDDYDVPEMHDGDPIPEDMQIDADWQDVVDLPMPTPAASKPAESDYNFLENQDGGEADLQTHLLDQLALTTLSDNDLTICYTLVQMVKDDGYLENTLQHAHESLPAELEIELDEVEAMHTLIMHLDPVGIGARDLQECLMVQLLETDEAWERTDDAKLLISDHFEALGKQNQAELMKKARLDEERLLDALSLIRELNPRPGSQIGTRNIEYIAPEVYVIRANGKWIASINPELAPSLQIQETYAGMIKRRDGSEQNQYLREKLQEARWFLNSLNSRNDTILKVAHAIVKRQQQFFDDGEKAMHPLILKDIAADVEMHESTISRVTSNKYMQTPFGMLEFKYFFSTQMEASDGDNTSSRAIKALIRELVDEENPQKPLSDNKITTMLGGEKGIKVARRTVAKYREALQIPPSNERKRII